MTTPRTMLAAVCLLMTQLPVADAASRGHPRLLVGPEDLARIRAAIAPKPITNPTSRPSVLAGSGMSTAMAGLRQAAEDALLEPGAELFAPALLHLVDGAPGIPDRWSEALSTSLLAPERREYAIDAILAMDWCWDTIPAESRDRLARRLARALEPLHLTESPFDHQTFSARLAGFAAAVVLENEPEAVEEISGKIKDVLKAADQYLGPRLIELCRQRGQVPTSGHAGIEEESDLILAVELYSSWKGKSAWPDFADSLGRLCEHYLYADTQPQSLGHGFLHDDGSYFPTRPGAGWGFAPAVPWVLARRVGDPVAAWYARQSSVIVGRRDARRAWPQVLYGPLEAAEVARRGCPLGRPLDGGYAVMRSGWEGGDTVVLFDVGQPFWRSRQHFDAGQFHIYRKVPLSTQGGDDVTFEAVAARGGHTTIAGQTGDWDDYIQATIAHNCLTVGDRRRTMRLYNRAWVAMGNQRLVGHDYTPSMGPVETTERWTGRLLAFESNSLYSYAVADLSAAYPRDMVVSYTRKLLFVHAGLVVVLDHLSAVGEDSIKTWHLQLPVAPVVDGGGLEAATQQHGVDASAGVWELKPGQKWIDLTRGPGRLLACSLLPEGARRMIVGGPMQPRKVPAGTYAGTTYYGGEALGYEHRLWPAEFYKAPNAAYELGSPARLGPHFGLRSTWGRLDVLAPPTREATFLHLLLPGDASPEPPPQMGFQVSGGKAVIDIALPGAQAQVVLGLQADDAGHLRLTWPRETEPYESDLAWNIVPAQPLPGAP